MPALPPGDVPAAFDQPAAGRAPLWPAADWWKGFGSDPQLTQLMAEAASEQSRHRASRGAAARRPMRARRQAGAALLPSLGFNANLNTLYGQANGTSLHETD